MRWHEGRYPTPAGGCASGPIISADGTSRSAACEAAEGAGGVYTCVCAVGVATSAVFTDPSRVPTQAEIEGRLAIGSAPPAAFDAGEYTECATSACAAAAPAVRVHLHTATGTGTGTGGSGSGGGVWDARTVFEVKANGSATSAYLLNRESRVAVGTNYSFRNPVHFVDHVEPTVHAHVHGHAPSSSCAPHVHTLWTPSSRRRMRPPCMCFPCTCTPSSCAPTHHHVYVHVHVHRCATRSTRRRRCSTT